MSKRKFERKDLTLQFGSRDFKFEPDSGWYNPDFDSQNQLKNAQADELLEKLTA
jgi:hypothetical protein